jgi:hypothetical protein
MQDLNAYALQLLTFVKDSVHEAIRDKASRQALLSEADCALRVLKRTLLREQREDYPIYTKAALTQIFNFDLEDIAKTNPSNLEDKLLEALSTILGDGKVLFQ